MNVFRIIGLLFIFTGASSCAAETVMEHYVKILSGEYSLQENYEAGEGPFIKIGFDSKNLSISLFNETKGTWDIDASTAPGSERYISEILFDKAWFANYAERDKLPIPEDWKFSVGSDGLVVRNYVGNVIYVLLHSPDGFDIRDYHIRNRYIMTGSFGGLALLKKID
jgi:hypothetical protein